MVVIFENRNNILKLQVTELPAFVDQNFFLYRSLSYVTCMGFMSFILLGVMYFVMDIKKWWGGQPFIYPGMRMQTLMHFIYNELTDMKKKTSCAFFNRNEFHFCLRGSFATGILLSF